MPIDPMKSNVDLQGQFRGEIYAKGHENKKTVQPPGKANAILHYSQD